MPRVSVCIPAYNHAAFVRQSLESVLAQTFGDFEIVVTDDGSTDETADVIAGVSDPRIKFRRFPANRGACVALNDAVRRSSGEYVAILNSDDAFLPRKLETQVAFLDAHPEVGAVFAYPAFIDEADRPIEITDSRRVFEQSNRSQADWLRYFFYSGNCLCHPTVLVRRVCYERVGLYDERLAQLPDFEQWVRLVARYPIHILPETMILLRELRGQRNASAPRPEVIVRLEFEAMAVARRFLDIDQHLFEEVFAEEIAELGVNSRAPRAYVLGRIALRSQQQRLVRLGINLLFDALPAQGPGVDDAYPGFGHLDLIRASGAYDIYRRYYALQAAQSLQAHQARIAELERALAEIGKKR